MDEVELVVHYVKEVKIEKKDITGEDGEPHAWTHIRLVRDDGSIMGVVAFHDERK